jgi:pentatricopeptide repeat-containing protein PET309
MLERATTCVEPAALHLLRRFEVPTRSNRVLLQSFWRHRGDDFAGPAWWPEYLRNVRRSSQARLQVERDVLRNTGNWGISSLEGAGQYLGINLQRNLLQPTRFVVEMQTRFDGSRQDRLYSRSCRGSQEHVPLLEMVDQQGLGTPNEKAGSPDQSTPISSTESSQNQTFQSPQPSPVYADPDELLLLIQERPDAFDEAWRLFISLQTQETYARQILQYLSKSKRRIDHERAVRAYKMLSSDRKTERTYANAMRVAISRRSQRLALEINYEALSRSLGSESSRIFFAYLARNNLWNTLAKALEDLRIIQRRAYSDSPDRDSQRTQKSFRRSGKSDEIWDQVWAEVDEMLQLPEKLLLLMRRIESASLSSPLKDSKMKRLASHLLYRVVQSSRIMAVITGNGFLSLFRQCAKIELLVPNHYYQAIRTLHKTLERRNRSQLAALAYRNLRFRFPETKIPQWIYGSLISIFTDAGQPSHSMRFLLDEFASMHGRPDRKAYQKVMVACARLGDVESVYEIFQRFSDSYGPPQDLGYITPLLYVHARLGDVARTQAQFDRLKSDFNIEPDTFCWNILLASHTRAKDSAGAFKIFRDMQRFGVKLDAYSFGTLMGLCANNGDTEAVHKLVDLARKENVLGTTAMVDTLVHSYCLNDEPESAKNLVEAATTMNLEGSQTRMWNTLLRYYAFQADSEAVLRVQERMREMSVKPDSMTYAALMTALVVIGKTQDAAQILRSLHFNEHLTATLFHYSIVLHGFALEGNRDMVSVIYNEILERFPRPSVSARLAVLHSQAKRDLSAWRARQMRIAPASKMLHLPRALDFLADILLETSQADLATKDPQPGFQRRSPVEALPSIYMEFLINSLNSSGAFSKAEKLLARCQSLIDTSFLGDAEKRKSSIQLLTAHMIGCMKKKEFARVDNCWNLIIAQAISHGRPLLRDPDSTRKGSFVSVSPPQPSSAVDIALPKADSLSGFTKSSSSHSEDDGAKVLPSQRYLLAAPITRYIQALGAQNLAALVPDLVEKLEKAGFSLNSKNYNTYVQVLTQSTNPQHQLLAFKVFEEKLLPNMPSWSLLRRGKWAPRPALERKEQTNEPDSELEPEQEPLPRKFIESFKPGHLVPTYYTMVFLATALIRFQRRGVRGEAMNLQLLRTHAPGTVDAVARLPYLQDRVQGVLLRGREVRGDFVKRPRRPPKPDRAGLRGSRSPLDHIPIDHAYEDRLPDAAIDVKDTTSSGSTQSNVWNANTYTEEILREPAVMERTGRAESGPAFHDRLRREEQERSVMVEQMRADAKKERLVSDIYFGEPHIESTNFKTNDTGFRENPVHKAMTISQGQPVLLDNARERLERVWEARRDGRGSYPVLSPARLRIGKRRYPKKLRLALPRSRVPPDSFAGDRPSGPNWLTMFKPPVPPTLRQSKAFILNKRALARRKVFRRQEIAVQNRIQALAQRQSRGQKREQEAPLKVNYRPFSR